jgi:membrane protein DedA with SNARE-associated domain
MGSVESYLQLLADHPLAVVFWSSLIEAMGIPFPSRVILILTPAFLITQQDFAGVVVAAIVGALLGDHVPYFAGRLAGTRMLGLYCRLTLGSEQCVEKTLRLFLRFRSLAILASRFSTNVRIFASACAGCGQVTYPRYLTLDAIGTTVYTIVFVGIGFLIGERAVVFFTTDRRRFLFLVFVVLAFATLIGYRLWRRFRHGGARASTLEEARALSQSHPPYTAPSSTG